MFGKIFGRKKKSKGDNSSKIEDAGLLYCPQCKDEYRPGVTSVCVSCNIELRPLSEMKKAEGPKGKIRKIAPEESCVVVKQGSSHEIRQTRILLESAGIASIMSADPEAMGKG